MSQRKQGVRRAVSTFRGRVDRLTKSIIVLAVLGIVGAIAGTVFAISNISPDQAPASQGPNSFLVIGRIGTAYNGETNTLPSAETSVKLVYERPPSFVNVFDGPWCATSQYGDRRANPADNPCTNPDPRTNVRFTFQSIDNNNGAPVGPSFVVNSYDMARNSGVNGNYLVDLRGRIQPFQSMDNRYFVTVNVAWERQNPANCQPTMTEAQGCLSGTNFFRFEIPSNAGGQNFVTYNVTNRGSNPMTVETAGPGVNRGDETNITFEFAPPCGATDAQRRSQLIWEDADFGESNEQGDDISWSLVEESPAGVTGPPVMSQPPNNGIGGQGQRRQSQMYQFKDGYKYRWTWFNVDSSNGVQVYLPFDSYNYIRDCATVDINKSATVRANQAVNEPFTYTLTINRRGPLLSTITINDTLPAQIQFIDDPSNSPPPTSRSGQSQTWTFGPGSPQLNELNTAGVTEITFRAQGTAVGRFTNNASGSALDVNGDPVGVSPDSESVTIRGVDLTNKPYFVARNGDVSAGGGMDLNGAQCTQAGGLPPHNDAGIVSWNRGPSNGNTGAGGQYGVFALNHIQGFVSGQNSPYDPGGVSFANVNGGGRFRFDPNAAQEGGIYGGQYGNLPCTPDFLADATGGVTGDQTLSAILGVAPGSTFTVPDGTIRTVYVSNGRLLIDVNVQFDGNYANSAAIPSFAVLVRGNIYISPSVARLDGLYVAQPTNGSATNGIIYSCAPDGFGTTGVNVLDRRLSTRCNSQLTFNGAVVARQLWLLRTFGSLAANVPAEVINFTPELWMNMQPSGSLNPAISDDYDAITGLPPVL